MGNGANIKSCVCCSQKEDLQQCDIDVEKNITTGNTNLKTMDLIKRDSNANKNEQNIIKTKSQNSSMNESNFQLKNKNYNHRNSYSPPITINNKYKSQQSKKIISYNNNQIKNKSLKNLDENNNEPKTKLILSGELFDNKIVEINKNGMKNSLRKKNDGISIFGIKNNNNNIHIYDYNLNLKNNEITGKIFKIFYDRNIKAYILKFINSSMILYYKINDLVYFYIEKDYYLIVGDIFLTINIKKYNDKKQINIQVEVENEKSKKYTFNQEEMPIKIGRSNCNINIQRNSISKIHSFICFSNDIFYYKDAKSTNGSSLLIKEEDFINIKGDMNFKLENTSFKIKEIPDNDEEY